MVKTADAFKDAVSPVSFDDTSVAFQDKSDGELFLSYVIFALTQRPLLTKIFSQSAKWAVAAGLPVQPLIKATVFRQFCGGETRKESAGVIERLGRSGIGAILDYAVEGNADETVFESTQKEILKIIAQSGNDKNIPCACMKMTGIGSFNVLEKITAGQPLDPSERQHRQKLIDRFDEICRAAARVGKPIYVDAEESWIQGAIDEMTEKMMAKYNKKRAVVFTTLQMYRLDRLDHLKKLIAAARDESFVLGVKFVRGAYLEKERERARSRGCPSPVHGAKVDTDNDYNEALRIVIEHIEEMEACAGTHNEHSCKLLALYMAEKQLAPNHPHIWFSQLYGMSDNISFNLAKSGYNVSKYLPYGPVEATLPYLLRRAEENTAIAGQMSKELKIIVKEKKRRRWKPRPPSIF